MGVDSIKSPILKEIQRTHTLVYKSSNIKLGIVVVSESVCTQESVLKMIICFWAQWWMKSLFFLSDMTFVSYISALFRYVYC